MTVGLVLWWFLPIVKITWARSWTTSPPTATSSKIDVNHGENHRSRYSTNIEFLAILKLAPHMIECLVHQQSSRHPCVHWLSSSGSPLLPLTCHYYQSNVVEGGAQARRWGAMAREDRAPGGWEKSWRQRLCLGATVAVTVLGPRGCRGPVSPWTLLDSPLTSLPPSSCHCLTTAFLIVECPHHRSIAASIFVDFYPPPTSPSNPSFVPVAQNAKQKIKKWVISKDRHSIKH